MRGGSYLLIGHPVVRLSPHGRCYNSRDGKGATVAQQIATQPETHPDGRGDVTINYISRQEGSRLLDRQARKYLGMSGDEFKRRYQAGTIEDPERSAVLRVSLLLPLAED